MDAVEDDLDEHVGIDERRACEAGLAGLEGTHRVEEVRDRPPSALEPAPRLVGRRARVAVGDGDAAAPQQVDELERAGELRRERDVGDAAGGEQSFQEHRVWVAPRLGRMRPEAVGGDERPFEVRAEDPRRPLLARQLAERRLELGLG